MQHNKKPIHLLFKNIQSNTIRFSVITDIYVKTRSGKKQQIFKVVPSGKWKRKLQLGGEGVMKRNLPFPVMCERETMQLLPA